MDEILSMNLEIRVANGSLLNHFFTQAVWSELLRTGHCRLYDAIVNRYVLPNFESVGAPTNRTILTMLEEFMSSYYRNEYFFRNCLLRHYYNKFANMSGQLSAMVQVKVAGSRADFVFINGKAIVYEIKTDQDNIERLFSQVKDYYKAFEYVYVVCGNRLLAELKMVLRKTDVGILLLDEDGTFVTIKSARRHSQGISADVIFNMLYRRERDCILQTVYGKIPEVKATHYVMESRSWFTKIPLDTILRLFNMILKERPVNDNAISHVNPTILSSLAYFWRTGEKLMPQLIRFLDSPYQRMPRRRRKLNELKVLPLF